MIEKDNNFPTTSDLLTRKGSRRLPKWVVGFIVIDLSLVFIISAAIAYIYIDNKLLPSLTASNQVLDNRTLAAGREEGLLFHHLPILLNRSSLKGLNRSLFGEPSLDFYGIDFSKNKLRVIITITPQDNNFNQGEPIVIPVFPARDCEFGDKTACVTAYKSSQQGNVIFLSVHSGVGGEAQRLRHAIEGTGINQAGYDLEYVMANLDALKGAIVTIRQDDVELGGFRMVSAARVPAQSIQNYFSFPVTEAIYQASLYNPGLIDLIDPGTTQLVIETCGWKMRGEPWAPEVTPTSASIYLGVIQKID